jgi:hypothetical protein
MQVFAIENGFLLIIQGGMGEISKAIYAKTEVDIGNEIIAEQARRVLEIEKINNTKPEPELDLVGVQAAQRAASNLAPEVWKALADASIMENFAEQTGRRKIKKLFETPHSRGC